MKTLRQFLTEKFPTNEYITCPFPERFWPIIEEYANDKVDSLLNGETHTIIIEPRSLEEHVAFSNENGDSHTEIIELKSIPSNQIDLEDMIADIKLKGK